MKTIPESVHVLVERLGIALHDAYVLRRISMTLHRWHEMECGNSNDYASSCLVRGVKDRGGAFEYDDDGKPYIERHAHQENKARYYPIPDREAGAKKRLAQVMKKYPHLKAFIQTDPRGTALYILPPDVSEYNYSRGFAVFK